MQSQRKFKLTKSEEKRLRDKLAKTILTIVGIVGGLIILVVFFAPVLGVFFGFFSRHRNETDLTTAIRPPAPLFSTVPHATKNDTLTLNGYAQSGMTITLYLNGPEYVKTTAGSDGMFTFNEIPLIQGTNTLYAKNTDAQGVDSENSNTFTVVVDKEKPKITVDSPKENEVVKNLDSRVKIIGKVNEKAALKINGKIAVMRPDLSFEFLLGLTEGETEIKIEATDEAGNTEVKQFKIKYVRGS